MASALPDYQISETPSEKLTLETLMDAFIKRYMRLMLTRIAEKEASTERKQPSTERKRLSISPRVQAPLPISAKRQQFLQTRTQAEDAKLAHRTRLIQQEKANQERKARRNKEHEEKRARKKELQADAWTE